MKHPIFATVVSNQCVVCLSTCARRGQAVNHMRQSFPNGKCAMDKASFNWEVAEVKNLKCKLCEFEVCSQEALRLHRLNIHLPKPFTAVCLPTALLEPSLQRTAVAMATLQVAAADGDNGAPAASGGTHRGQQRLQSRKSNEESGSHRRSGTPLERTSGEPTAAYFSTLPEEGSKKPTGKGRTAKRGEEEGDSKLNIVLVKSVL